MRLEDVDGVEGDLVFVLIVELVEGRNLPPEGRSGVAAKDEDDWLFAAERTELHVGRFVERGKRKVGRHFAGLNGACACARPQGFEGQSNEGDDGRPRHDASEALGRLVHGVIKEDDAGKPDTGQYSGRLPGDFTNTFPVDIELPQACPHRWLMVAAIVRCVRNLFVLAKQAGEAQGSEGTGPEVQGL
jgi:hypothetical protein